MALSAIYCCRHCGVSVIASPSSSAAAANLCQQCVGDEDEITDTVIIHELRNAVLPARAALKMLREEDTSAERREKLLDRVELGLLRVERLANDLAEKERS